STVGPTHQYDCDSDLCEMARRQISIISKSGPFVYLNFFFHRPAPAEIDTLSLHDALPIYVQTLPYKLSPQELTLYNAVTAYVQRSEEHTSELQSPCNLVCRLLLEKKNQEIYRSDLADSSTASTNPIY